MLRSLPERRSGTAKMPALKRGRSDRHQAVTVRIGSLTEIMRSAYTESMTAARDYDHLRHLVDRLPPNQVRRLLHLARRDPELAAYTDGPTPAGKPGEEDDGHTLATAGIFDSGRGDLSERVEEFIQERFNHCL
jgi:hypothetical protein